MIQQKEAVQKMKNMFVMPGDFYKFSAAFFLKVVYPQEQTARRHEITCHPLNSTFTCAWHYMKRMQRKFRGIFSFPESHEVADKFESRSWIGLGLGKQAGQHKPFGNPQHRLAAPQA